MYPNYWLSISVAAVTLVQHLTGFGRAYCRLTLAFVLGLYLPTALEAPDLARHFGEALHNWTIIFFAPLALWGLLDMSGRLAALRTCRQDKPAMR